MRNELRTLREERGWSQGVLADRLDVSRQTVNALENGRYDPSLPLAFRVGRLFGQPIEAIFHPDDGDDDPIEPGEAAPGARSRTAARR